MNEGGDVVLMVGMSLVCEKILLAVERHDKADVKRTCGAERVDAAFQRANHGNVRGHGVKALFHFFGVARYVVRRSFQFI